MFIEGRREDKRFWKMAAV